jgi:type I restriction enzyme S subunit
LTLANGHRQMTLSDLLTDGLFLDGDWVESKDQDPSGDVRLIQLADIGDGTFHNRSRRFLTSKRARELGCTFLETGDILIARMPDPLGRACLFPGVGQPAVTAVDVCIVRPNSARAYPEWLMKAINSPQFRQSMQAHIRGTTRQRISRKNLGTLTLSVPGVNEQHALAKHLDELDGPRERAGHHLRLSREALEHFRQSVLTAACTGRLTAKWRVSNHSPMTQTPLRSNAVQLAETPDEWQWRHLGDIADIQGGIQKGARLRPGDPTREVPYLRVANVQRGWLDMSEIKTIAVPEAIASKLALRPGDILFNEGGDRDKLGRGWIWEGQIRECIHQNHVFRARLRDTMMQPKFFSWFGNTVASAYFFGEGKQTVNLASLSMTKLRGLPVPIPNPDEQQEIVRVVDALLTQADSIEQRLQLVATRLGKVSHAVLDAALGNLMNGAAATASAQG